jgi:hypothetical protein
MAVAVAAVSKDASAITVTTPDRGNSTCNNQQPAQQKDERADKRSGSENATRGDRLSRDCSL